MEQESRHWRELSARDSTSQSCISMPFTGILAGYLLTLSKFREEVAELAGQDAWVMDGNYTSHLDLRIPRAQAIIWLDLPRYIYFPRALWRSIRNLGRERPDVGRGNREKFELAFFRDWVWTYPKRSRERHAQLMANLPNAIDGFVLESRREVTQFVANLPDSLDICTGKLNKISSIALTTSTSLFGVQY